MQVSSPLKKLFAPLVNPAVYDFWVGHLNPVWAWRRALARVLAVRQVSLDSVTLELRANRNFAGFRPGQHINLSVEIDGVRHTRSYSPCDQAHADGRLAITVKRIPGGRVSNYLCDRVRPGDVLELGPAFGEMTLPVPAQPLLLLAGGSGITPLLSQVRALTARPLENDVTLIYWARTRAELCYREELRLLAESEPRLTVRFALTGEAASEVDEFTGRPSVELLRGINNLAGRHVHACGPAGFVDSVRDLLADQVAAFHAEAFTPPKQVTREGAPVQVTLQRSGRRVSVASGKPLLGALEEQGIKLPHGCRMGICNSCACHKVSGLTRNAHDGREDAEPGSQLRICINAAQSDLVLDV